LSLKDKKNNIKVSNENNAKILLICFQVAVQALNVWVNDSGAVHIMSGNEVWLISDEVVIGSYAFSQGEIELVDRREWTSEDSVLGTYKGISLGWALKETKEILMNTTLRIGSSQVLFEQRFPNGLENVTNSTASYALTVFPAFLRTSNIKDRACFAYHGVFPALKSCTIQSYKESWQGGQPLVLYDNETALVFSALDKPKAQHMVTTDEWFGAGVKSGIATISTNWTQRWLLSETVDSSREAPPIRRAMEKWGAEFLAILGIENALHSNRYRDKVHGAIGFWTDNGGYYHYSTGIPSNQTYEEAFIQVKKYHDTLQIPFGHWQFDSWFYPKDGDVDGGGGGGAVVNWTSMDSVFPSGLPYVINTILDGMPLVAHNRQWSVESDYIQHKSASVEWFTTGSPPTGAAIPKDPDTFFAFFFNQQTDWNLQMYEQDWLSKEYDLVDAFQTNLTLGDDWLRAMAENVFASNRTMQMCMPYAHDILAGASFRGVTNARATDDYFHAPNHSNWAIGTTSLFYSSLGILPFKDGFYSSSLKQIGGQTVGPEPAPDREILMAVLSAAMVGPMDGLGLLNKTRVMATCRNDGVILKPDFPVTTSDICFSSLSYAPPENCYIFSASSTLSKYGQVHYLFLDDPISANNFSLPTLLSSTFNTSVAVLDWYASTLIGYADNTTLYSKVAAKPSYEGHAYAIIAPVVNGWTFFGQLGVYVPVSSLRFISVRPTSLRLYLDILLMPNETISVCAARQPSTSLICQNASWDENQSTEFHDDHILFDDSHSWLPQGGPRLHHLTIPSPSPFPSSSSPPLSEIASF